MKQLPFFEHVKDRGYDLSSQMYKIYLDIMGTFSNYEFAYQYISGSAKKDIEEAQEPGMHLIIEPLILPAVSNALFIGMYGDVEAYLNKICNAHKTSKNLNISLKDISGQGIERAVTYLNKVVGIEGIKSSTEWSELKKWNLIRNILVHNNGVIRDNNDVTIINSLRLGIDSEENRVSLVIDDCDRFHHLLVNFFRLCI
ncbi:hypothetical protein [Paenibacillus sp. FSL R7-0179]|uniref:hypothetical protein n=1 Tax=Paenibacillus sp. FSL R7-0179 TaxID=2921672 RepID=UPI0030F7FDCC